MVTPLEKNEVEHDFVWYPKPAETQSDKFIRKFKENPFVPIGAGLTVTALVIGLVNLKRGNSAKQQTMMRARVVAQGSTIVAIIAGFLYHQYKKKQ
uniref:HIG1 domain family member 2A n=1 Tax=Hydra vulgaris TaxID=6087 RepID=T2M6P8_HYDVU|nr:HIG1 domain family member 2A, mitochondrial [Hydra vulgaris]